MAQQGFQRDVTTPIKVPQVQAPNFAQNRSIVEDIADVASFGLQVFDRASAATKETKRVENLATADASVNTLINEYNSILSQPKGSLQAANAFVQKRIASLPNSGYVRDQFSKGILATRQDYKTGIAGRDKKQEFPDDFISNKANDDVFQLVKLENKWDETAPQGSDKRATQNVALRKKLISIEDNAVKQEQLSLKLDKTEVERKEAIGLHYEQYSLTNTLVLNELSDLLQQSKNAPIGEQAQLLGQIDEITTNLETAFIQQGLQKLGPDATDQERSTLTANATAFFGQQRKSTQEYREASTKALSLFTTDHNINSWQAGNILTQLRAIAGDSVAGIGLMEFIAKENLPREAVVETIGRAYGLNREQRAGIDKERLTNYLAGGNTIQGLDDIPFRQGEKEALFKSGYKYYKGLLDKGDLQSMEGVDARVASAGLVNVLNDFNSQDPATTSQILSIVGDPDMTKYLKNLDADGAESKNTADGIRNMIVTTAKGSLRNDGGSLSKINKWAGSSSFNIKKGEFTIDKVKTVEGFGGVPLQGTADDNAKRQRAQKQANKAIKVFLEEKKGNPALAEMTDEEALHWLLKGGSGNVTLSDDVNITGGELIRPVASEAQIEQQETRTAYKARIDARTNVLDNAEKLRQKSVDIKESGIPKQPETKDPSKVIDLSDMPDAETSIVALEMKIKELKELQKQEEFAAMNKDKL